MAKTIIFRTKSLSLYQTSEGDAFIESTKLTNKSLNKIFELGRQRHILRLQPVCAAKLFPVPKQAVGLEYIKVRQDIILKFLASTPDGSKPSVSIL